MATLESEESFENFQEDAVDLVWARGLVGSTLGLTRVCMPHPSPAPKLSELYHFIPNVRTSESLGHGGFSKAVHAAVHKKSGTPVAVKVVPKDVLPENYMRNHVDRGNFHALLTLSKNTPHKNVVCYHDFLTSEANVFPIMDRLDGPDLGRAVQELAPVPIEFTKLVIQQGFAALTHIHSAMIHRDIKLANFHFRSTDVWASPLVLIDFGLSCPIEPKSERRDIVGTEVFMAPEIFSHIYDTQADVWSFGVCVWILLTGKYPPFDPHHLEHPETMMEHALQVAFKASESEMKLIPTGAVDLLRNLLVVDPALRHTAAKASAHPWLQEKDLRSHQSATATSLGASCADYADCSNRIAESVALSSFTSRTTNPSHGLPQKSRLKHSHSTLPDIDTISKTGGSKSMPHSPAKRVQMERISEDAVVEENDKLAQKIPWVTTAKLLGIGIGGVLAIMHPSRKLLAQRMAIPRNVTLTSFLFGGWLVLACFRRRTESSEAIRMQDGPELLVRKARRVRHKSLRAELLGEIRMLGKDQWAHSEKDYSAMIHDLEHTIDKQLTREGQSTAVRKEGGSPLPPTVFLGGLRLAFSQYFFKTPSHVTMAWINKTYGKVAMVRWFHKWTLFVSDLNVFEEIENRQPLMAPHQTNYIMQRAAHLGANDLSFCDYGHQWHRMRKASTQCFAAQIPNTAQQGSIQAQALCTRIVDKLPFIFSTGEVDMLHEFRMILINNLSSALYGESFKDNEKNIFDKNVGELFRLMVAFNPYDYSDLFEHVPPHTRYMKEMDTVLGNLLGLHHKYFDSILANFDPRQGKCSCVCEEYLKLRLTDPSAALSDFEVISMMHNLLSAGVDSTSVLGPWTLAFMLHHPEVVAKIHQEIGATTEGHHRWLTRDDLTRLPWLAACIKEAARMRPPFPLLTRSTGNEWHDVCGFAIPPHTQIVFGVNVMNNSEECCDEPHKFKPERWLEEGARFYPRKLRSFGGGVRICLGNQLAFENIMFILGALIQNFNIETLGGVPPEVELKGNSFSITPEPYKLSVTVRPHSPISRAHATLEELNKKHTALQQSLANGEPQQPQMAKSGGKKLNVFFCSTTGTSEQMATSLKNVAALDVDAVDLRAWKGTLPTEVPCVFVVSTFYNGAPPDAGKAFHDWLSAAPDGKLKGLEFAVFGNGNKQYEHFNWMAKEVEKHLLRLGGTQILETGLADSSDNAEATWDLWQHELIAKLTPGDATYDAFHETNLVRDWAIEWERHDAQLNESASMPLKLKSRRELRQDTSQGSCCEICYELDGLSYDVAENLLLYPENSAEVVESLAARLTPPRKDDLDKPFNLKWIGAGPPPPEPPIACPTTLRRVLTRECDLTSKPRKTLLRELATLSNDISEREALRVLLAPSGAEWFELKTAKGITILDFLLEYSSIQLSMESFLTLLPGFRMQPRRYTIASSPLADPQLLRLTVTIHEKKFFVDGKRLHGLCTGWQRSIAVGHRCRGVVQPSGFVPPSKSDAPIIMVGAGSGIAPAIAFGEMREALLLKGQPLGEAMFFFGCRHPDKDFLHRDRLESWARNGVITEVIPAFSRPDGGEKQYVQDAVRSRAKDLAALIHQGAYIYICGATAMGMGVRDALVAGGALESLEKVKQLEAEGRYVQELWS